MLLRPPAQDAADPGEGFGEGVDLLAELTPLPFVELLVADPAVALLVGLYLLLDCPEARVYLRHELGVLTLYDRLHELESDSGPLHVRSYIVKVGVRVALLFARDLGRGYLVQELDRPEDGVRGLQ